MRGINCSFILRTFVTLSLSRIPIFNANPHPYPNPNPYLNPNIPSGNGLALFSPRLSPQLGSLFFQPHPNPHPYPYLNPNPNPNPHPHPHPNPFGILVTTDTTRRLSRMWYVATHRMIKLVAVRRFPPKILLPLEVRTSKVVLFVCKAASGTNTEQCRGSMLF